jgi:hypothetical protein
MNAKTYLVVGLLAIGGALVGVYLRGYSDAAGWTTAA